MSISNLKHKSPYIFFILEVLLISFGFRCCLKLLTIVFVTLAPMIPLAIDLTIVDLFTGAALLVLYSFTLGTRAVRAQYDVCSSALILLLILDSCGELSLCFEPLLRGVVHPRVKYGDGGTDNLCGWGLLWAKSIEHVVLSFLTKHIKLSFKELCNQINRVLSYFLFLLITFLSLGLLVIVQCPNTSITKNRTKVDFESAHKILMVESHDLLDKVLDEHSYHPNLLVSHCTALSFVHSVTS